ncbi:hypothetical protein BRD00_06995 [Halobacteriales archaeon QS_8_69_26]|nr:MAG: hypothetical protein BRD00_06995 [Halobacteriales archaeon QS_8_69_26]
MNSEEREACGRCSMSSVAGMIQEDEESSAPDPFGEERIEVDEDEMRTVSPHVVALGNLKRRINEFATKITYGR